MFRRVCTKKTGNTVVLHSLNYTDSYEIDVELTIFSHVVESGVRSCWNVKYIFLRKILPRYYDEAHYTLYKFCTVHTSFFLA